MPRLRRALSFPSALCLALAPLPALAAPAAAQTQQHLRDTEIHDTDTLAWWHTTVALSDDSMEGRDTGSAAYQDRKSVV